jgi:hypothetical protein
MPLEAVDAALDRVALAVVHLVELWGTPSAPILEIRSLEQNVEVDGWPYFARVVDHSNATESDT